MGGMATARPLTGEPLGIDLLNTTWRGASGVVDLLADVAGTRAWLDEVAIESPPSEACRAALIVAREAIRGHVDHPESGSARAALNEVLTWGFSRPVLGVYCVRTEFAAEDPARLPGWLAAADYARLVSTTPDRIRRCAHPDCVLYFVDTSARGTRRWCSMAGCGNRAKAARHYARTREVST